MSKSALKKQLAQMDRDEMAELIIDLYDARKEAKDYLDFFVEPDIEARLTKARTAIGKEAGRTSRGRARPRITKVRRVIKDISTLNPGAEAECDIMAFTIETFCDVGSESWVKDVTQKSLAKLLHDTIVRADKAGLLNFFLPRIEAAVKEMRGDKFYNRDMKSLLSTTLEETISSL